MRIIDKREHLDLSPGSVVEDSTGIFLITIGRKIEYRNIECIKAYGEDHDWEFMDCVHNGELRSFFDKNAHNLSVTMEIE